jgi:hypothetical protein
MKIRYRVAKSVFAALWLVSIILVLVASLSASWLYVATPIAVLPFSSSENVHARYDLLLTLERHSLLREPSIVSSSWFAAAWRACHDCSFFSFAFGTGLSRFRTQIFSIDKLGVDVNVTTASALDLVVNSIVFWRPGSLQGFEPSVPSVRLTARFR